MKFTAKMIADLLQGSVVGDPEASVDSISKIEEGKIGTLSFLANPKYEKYIYETESSIVLVNADFVPTGEIKATLIKVKDAYQAFAQLLELYNVSQKKTGIDSLAFIDPSAKIGENVYIGAFAYIGENAVIEDNVQIYPQVYVAKNVQVKKDTSLASGVKIYHDCVIGRNCILHAGVVIGSDGFGFVPQTNQDHKKVPQIGNVVIEDNVEIGANSTIDRATIGSTFIRKGVKLDNMVMIAHNVDIGERTVIAAQTGVSGSTKIGKDCMIGGQVGIAGHLIIADKVCLGAQSGLGSNVTEEGLILQGYPVMPYKNFYRSAAVFKNLPEMAKKIHQLEKEIQALKSKIL